MNRPVDTPTLDGGASGVDTTAAERPGSVRRALNLYMVGGCIGIMASSICTGLARTQFAQVLHMPAVGFSILGSLALFGSVFSLLGSLAVERYGRRKRLAIVGGLVFRSMWILIALIPLVWPVAWNWVAALVLIGLSWSCYAFIQPAQWIWMADLIPRRIQGRYYSRRSSLTMVVSLSVSLLVGFLLDLGQKGGPTGLKYMVVGIFIAAGLIGAVEYMLYSRIPDPPTHRPSPSKGLWSLLKKPLKDREYLCAMFYYNGHLFNTVLTYSFIVLYLLNVVKLGNLKLTICWDVMTLGICVAAYPFWGKVVDRVGYKPVFTLCGLVLIFHTVWVIFLTPNRFFLPYFLGMVTFFFGPGIEMGQTIISFDRGKSTDGEGNSSYSALSGIFVTLAGIAASAVSGGLGWYLGMDWHGSVAGVPLTFHGVLFLIAAGVRVVMLLFLLGVKNHKGYSLGQTCKVAAEQAMADARRWIALPRRWLKRSPHPRTG